MSLSQYISKRSASAKQSNGNEMDATTTAAAAALVPPVNATAAAANAEPDATQLEAPKTPIDRLRDAVEKNPLDFNSWVQLLALVEAEVRARASFASMLGQGLVSYCCDELCTCSRRWRRRL